MIFLRIVSQGDMHNHVDGISSLEFEAYQQNSHGTFQTGISSKKRRKTRDAAMTCSTQTNEQMQRTAPALSSIQFIARSTQLKKISQWVSKLGPTSNQENSFRPFHLLFQLLQNTKHREKDRYVRRKRELRKIYAHFAPPVLRSDYIHPREHRVF